MSRKPLSTIAPKPEVSSTLEGWISGANQNTPAPMDAASAILPAGQPASQPASPEATRMLSVRIPASLHQKLRVHSVSQGLQIQDIVSELLERYLRESGD